MADELPEIQTQDTESASRRDLFQLGALLGVAAMPAAAAAGPLRAGPDVYQSIGVEPVINCRGTFTIIGASIELPEVRAAMDAASQHFVQLDELAHGVGQRLAEITGAEWGMVSAGCAAGLKHVAAACVSGGNPEKLLRIPDLTGLDKTECVVPRTSRSVYDHAIRNIGLKMINVDTAEEFQSALSSRTAMIYLNSGGSADSGPLSLENIARMAKPWGIPILVDAAAEVLTIPNIHWLGALRWWLIRAVKRSAGRSARGYYWGGRTFCSRPGRRVRRITGRGGITRWAGKRPSAWWPPWRPGRSGTTRPNGRGGWAIWTRLPSA